MPIPSFPAPRVSTASGVRARAPRSGFIWDATSAGEIEIYGLTPFFDGKSEVTLSLTGALHDSDDNPFEGVLRASIPAAGEEAGYPIAFQAVDYALSCAGPFPAERRVRLSAFARELSVYENESAYFAARAGDEGLKLAAQAYVPIGLLSVEPSAEGEPPPALPATVAVFTGRVLEHSQLTNEVTSQTFDWVVVETLDMTLDVVADPSVVRGPLAEGATVEISALMFGRVLG